MKRLTFIAIILFLATFIQLYWSLGQLSDTISSSCLECSFLYDTIIMSLITSTLLALLFSILTTIKNKFINGTLQFTSLAVTWLYWNYTTFVDRVSSWSTYILKEEIRYTVTHSFVPILVMVSAVLWVLHIKKHKK